PGRHRDETRVRASFARLDERHCRGDLAAGPSHERTQRRPWRKVLDVRAHPLVPQHRLVMRPGPQRGIPGLFELHESVATFDAFDAKLFRLQLDRDAHRAPRPKMTVLTVWKQIARSRNSD